MSKICKLFINENIKTWKKFSTKLAIVLCILALIGVLALVQLMKYIEEKEALEYVDNSEWRERAQEEIKYSKQELLVENLEQEERSYIENRIKVYELSLRYDVNIFGDSWKNKILQGMMVSPEIDEKLIQLIEKDDFTGYIQMQKDEQKQKLNNKEITQAEYDDQMIILDLYDKCEIGKNDININSYYFDWRESIISEIQSMQSSLRTGIDNQTNKVLTVEKKQEYEDEIKIDIYRIENNIVPFEYAYTECFRMMYETMAISFVTSVIAIFAIIIAGGAIASEISTGTIKFWALTPNKRWKILTAKILSLLFYTVLVTLLMAVLTVACSNIFFDTPGNEYLYVKDGNVETLGNALFIIVNYFAKMIPVIVFTLFALMLSVVTRNSSAAISFSVGIYMGNSVVMSILNTYIKKDWVRFIPFNNLNIADKIFPNFEGFVTTSETFATSTSLGFSFAVLGICVVLMLVTAYDSFNNRDIV